MQMIDVLKRLAELDAENPNVAQPTMKAEQSLGTISNISECVNECGGMMDAPRTPASFSINASAESGDEVANMITQIMNLAGVKKDAGVDVELPALPAPGGDKGVELGEPHGAELDGGNDDMADMISMIDRLNGPEGDDAEADSTGDDKESIDNFDNRDGQQSPIADMADEVQGMADELADRNEESYDNSPEEEVRGHDYGDTQVTPKPQGLKQRLGDNPYKPTQESVDTMASRLMQEYQKYVTEGIEDKLAAAREKAAAKGKIKDKEEKASSPVRKVAGKAYGGSKQKDDQEVDESTGDYSAKKAAAGKDIGKPGKQFAKIAAKAGKQYGSKERGEKVAGAVLAKLRKG